FWGESCWCFFFFFQAEDGIRDFHVTGVQTCALPICVRFRRLQPFTYQVQVWLWRGNAPRALLLEAMKDIHRVLDPHRVHGPVCRSEERRVGKEGRVRGFVEYVKRE